MNCREAQPQIFAERDDALDATQRAALDGHLAHCDACRQIRERLTTALLAWRTESAHVAIPDVEREWHAVRRRIRGDAGAGGADTNATVGAGAGRADRPRRKLSPWLALPVGAAAAVAMTFFVAQQATPPAETPPSLPAQTAVARADAVEAPGNNASTTVFVDEQSGWLIVWASDATD